MERVDYEEEKIQMLYDIQKILDNENIKWSLSHGTLLGCIREGRHLPQEIDIDIDVWYDDYEKLVNTQDKFEKKGYAINGKWRNLLKYSPLELYLQKPYVPATFHQWVKDKNIALKIDHGHKRGIICCKIDETQSIIKNNNKLYNFIKKMPTIYTIVSELICILRLFVSKRMIMPYDVFGRLKKMKMYNIYVNVPNNPDIYLKNLYGGNWRIPIHKKIYTRKKWMEDIECIKKYHIQDYEIKKKWIKRHRRKSNVNYHSMNWVVFLLRR